MPKFSVIIPAYNDAPYLSAAVKSVLAQTFADYEIIVIDDGSTDDTRNVKRLFPMVRYIYQKNQGAYAARNAGIRAAEGELLAFLDADDTWFPDTLERHNQYLEEHPEIGMVHGYLDTMDKDGHPLPELSRKGRELWKRLNENGINYESIILDAAFHFDTCVLRKSALPAIGGFDERIPVCEDLDFLLRVAAKVKIGFLDGKSLASFRMHNNGFEFRVFNEGRIDVMKKHLALVISNAFPVDVGTASRNLRLSLSSVCLTLGDKKNGRRYFLEAVLRNPSSLLLPNYLRAFLFSFVPRRVKDFLKGPGRSENPACRQT